MERKPDSANRISKVRRIPYCTTTKLEGGHKVNRNSKRSYKKTIWQKETKFIRIEDREKYVARSQKYPFELTLEKARPEKIQIF